ncbi:stage III sporulation protein AG [Bacillus kwashiorkori]|uniref:stage III sporulation protein AG n=1 Tax=Bacillus kwashiorkori TaxID=1522318 RepID=UPI00078595A3|nr:stage III sporulation protein AG [Bacillus kwashiorkori]
MNEEKGPLTSIKKWLNQTNNSQNDKLNKKHYLLLVLVIGIAFMLFSSFINNDQDDKQLPVTSNESAEDRDVEVFGKSKDTDFNTMAEYERYYENSIKEALESIVGVEDVTVVVNVDSTEKKVYEKNKIQKNQTTDETDANGGKRKVEDRTTEEQMVIIREAEKEIPLVSETKKPNIRGVLVVAKGAENIAVKKMIIEAVMRVLDVPSHRVSVLAKK